MSPSVVSSSSRRSVLRPFLLSLLSFFLALTVLPSRAAIDLRLNTSSFVPGQQSELSIDGVVTPGGDRTITGAFALVRFDAARLAFVSFRVNTEAGWTLQAQNTDNAGVGDVRLLLTHMQGDGQAVTGPIVFVTLRPLVEGLDITDCYTLALDASECQLSNQDFLPVGISDPCHGEWNGATSQAPPPPAAPTDAGSAGLPAAPTDGDGAAGDGPMGAEPGGAIGFAHEAAHILRVIGGLTVSQEEDMEALDRNADDKITFADAVLLMKATSPVVARGWYTFQGNRRRTGRSSVPIRRAPVLQWNPVGLPSPGEYPSQSDLTPSVVAVPSTFDARYPVVYAVVSDGINSNLYRIEDRGSTTITSVYHFPIPETNPPLAYAFEARGTPLVLTAADGSGKHSVIVAGYGDKAHVFRIDVDSVDGAPRFTQVWHREWEGDISATPAFYTGPLSWWEGDSISTAVPKTEAPGQAVILAANEVAGDERSAGYLLALDVRTGARRWGYVNTRGDALSVRVDPLDRETAGGLYPFASETGSYYGATSSGPALKAGDPEHGVPAAAYANDASCYENARDLRTGAFLWEKAYSLTPPVESTTVLFEDKVYFGQLSSDSAPSVAVLKEQADRHAATPWWGVSITGSNDRRVYGTPAVHRESRTLIFGDDGGNVFGVGTERNPLSPNLPVPDRRWTAPYPLASPVRSSPLVANDPSGAGMAFIGADNGHVYGFNVSTGGAPFWDSGPLNGGIRSGMAAYKGRFYVLTTGDPGADPRLPPTVYCFQ